MDIDEILGVAAICATILAVSAWLAEHRRLRRSELDRVGWMPWTTVFFWALLAAIMLLGLAIKARFSGA